MVHGPTGMPRGAVELAESRGRFSQQRRGGTRSRDPFHGANVAAEDVSSQPRAGRRVQLRERKPSPRAPKVVQRCDFIGMLVSMLQGNVFGRPSWEGLCKLAARSREICPNPC